jgi:hypothetical protein
MRRTVLWAACLTILSNVAVPAFSAESKEPSEPLLYTLEAATGDVTIVRSTETQSRKAKEGDTLQEGDQVRVGSGGEAVLFLDEDTVVHVGSSSEMRIERLRPSEGGGFLNRLQLLAGRVLSEVKNLSKSRSTFEVESGGVVCGVRGTAFEVERLGEQVETATYEGEVEVRTGDAMERVKAGYRYGFLKNRLQMKRRLDRMEKDRFDRWVKQRKTLRERHLKRLKALREKSKKRPLRRLPPKRTRR